MKRIACFSCANLMLAVASYSPGEVAKIRLLAGFEMKQIDCCPLASTEEPLSMLATSGLEDAPGEVLIVGTMFYESNEGIEEFEPRKGRILCFSIIGNEDRKRLKLISHLEVSGGVYAMSVVKGKLVACVNGTVS